MSEKIVRGPYPEPSVDALIARRAKEDPDRTFLDFLVDGEPTGPIDRLTFLELERRVAAVAAHLSAAAAAGDRAVLLYDAGRSFVVAFFAAMRAGLIPVPAFPPDPANLSRSLPRLTAIVSDAQPSLILSTTSIADIAKGFAGSIPGLSGIRWIGTDGLETGTMVRDCNRDLRAESVAFLQYTSGSTRAPRGVIVSHANLMANAHAIDQVLGKGVRPKVMVGWLPMFHDNGLIGHIIYPLCAGYSSVIMSPLHFLQRPGRWIEALSRFGAHVTGAPNFGYELCTRRASTVLSSDVDLSGLEVAYCGAEPVRAETLDRFAAQFSKFGFSPKAFLPAYGLAEATLVVSTGPAGSGYRQKSVIARSLQGTVSPAAARRDHERRVVSCGEPLIGTKVVVVDPEQRASLAPGEVGEIWVKNDAVARGYWRRENEQGTFGATTVDGDGPFLRTGDLGALVDGELCVTGRLKDLLIIAGRNYYPQDIEYVVEKHPAIRTGCVAAFTVERTGSEVLVVAAEVSKALPPEGDVGESGALRSVIEELTRAVVDECQVSPVDVVLLKPGDAPKTSSGKIQRHRAREAYLSGSLDAIASALQLGLGATGDPWTSPDGTEPQTLSAWLTAAVARTLGRSVDADTDLIDAGMTSLAILDVMEALRRRTSLEISNEALWRCRSIAKLVQFVEEEPLQAAVADEPIVVVPDLDRLHEAFPLNGIQNAYWLGRQDAYELGQVACHYYTEFDGKGLDPARVNAAWNAVVRRHPMLRAVVLPDGQQRVLPQVPEYHGEEEDLSRLEPAAKDRRLAEVRALLSHRVPDAARWPLLEFRLLRLDGETWRMCLSVDLLVADIWSLLIMGQDWARLYHGDALDEPAPQLSFRDCVIAEDRLRSTAQYRRAWEYWEDRARSLPDGPKLPVLRPSSAGDRPRFERLAGRLDRVTWNRLKGMAAKAGLSPTGLVAAAFTEVLAEWCDTPAFTLNLTLFNRPAFHEQINKIVGDFTTLLLLETPGWQGLPTFRTRARKLQTQLWQDLEHRAVNGIDVLAHINQSRGDKKPLRVPVVLTSAIGMADLTGTDVAGINWPGQRIFSVSQTPQVWLDHQVSDWSGSLEYSWDVVTDIFPVGLPQTMFDAYQKLLLRLTDEAAWEDPDLSPAGQIHWDAWAAYNDTKAEQPGGLLQEPVLERAREQPDRPAVLSTRRCLTYGELQHWTETIAESLRRLGVRSGSLVGVLMHHGWEQVPATIGILAAGGAYVPIDAALPENRIRSLLAISETKVVLSQSWAAAFAWPDGVARVDVDLLEPGRDSPRPSAPKAQPSDLAYVIFTSGSTGEPKGVMIEHRSALNTVKDINRRFNITADDRVLGVSRLSFDLSVWDIFGALAAGAALVVPEEDERAEPQALLDLMRRYRVSVWNSAPPLMEMLSNYAKGTPGLPNDLRLAMLSGDWIPLHLPPALKDLFPAVEVISLGGAT